MSFQPDEIPDLVREVVTRTMGNRSQRVSINEEMVRKMAPGSIYVVPENALITPLARQLALERKIQLVDQAVLDANPGQNAIELSSNISRSRTPVGQKLVALGADHGGYTLKEQLKGVVSGGGFAVIDCGTNSTDSVDYPDFAYAVARLVGDRQAWRGIIVDGAGIGSCMAANKVPGVRAAMCYDHATAVNSREHNNANVLTLGAGLIGPNLAGQIVKTWLGTGFGGGRHGRRVDKIDAIGERFMKNTR